MEIELDERNKLIISILEEDGFVINKGESKHMICMYKEVYKKDKRDKKEILTIFVDFPVGVNESEIRFCTRLSLLEREAYYYYPMNEFNIYQKQVLDREITTENRNIVVNRTKRRIKGGIDEMNNTSDLIVRLLSNENIKWETNINISGLLFRCKLCKKEIVGITSENYANGFVGNEKIFVENPEELNTQCSNCIFDI